MTDVLEHFDDINDLFKITWNYAFITYPETPKVKDYEELTVWKHFKPNEHIYCLNEIGFKEWLEFNGCKVIASSHIEDAIRGCLHDNVSNTTTFLVKRCD